MLNIFCMDGVGVCARVVVYGEKRDDESSALHHLMMRQDSTVEQVELLLVQGARVDKKNKEGNDPYHCGIKYRGGESPNNFEGSCFYNSKVTNFVHSKMLTMKLRELIEHQYRQEASFPWRVKAVVKK